MFDVNSVDLRRLIVSWLDVKSVCAYSSTSQECFALTQDLESSNQIWKPLYHTRFPCLVKSAQSVHKSWVDCSSVECQRATHFTNLEVNNPQVRRNYMDFKVQYAIRTRTLCRKAYRWLYNNNSFHVQNCHAAEVRRLERQKQLVCDAQATLATRSKLLARLQTSVTRMAHQIKVHGSPGGVTALFAKATERRAPKRRRCSQ
jgi:hypothetical protein